MMSEQNLFPINFAGTMGQYGEIKDIDSVDVTGFYQCTGSSGMSGSLPSSTTFTGVLLHLNANGYKAQILISNSTDGAATLAHARFATGSVWRSWADLG